MKWTLETPESAISDLEDCDRLKMSETECYLKIDKIQKNKRFKKYSESILIQFPLKFPFKVSPQNIP